MFYSEVANLTQFLSYTALSGCQGGPGRSLKILSLRVASCRLRAGRWLQRSKAKGHQLGGYREWYPKIRREHCSAGETMGKPGNQSFFFLNGVLQLHPQIWHYYDILSHCTSESLAMAPHTALMFVLLICCCFSCDCLTFLRYCCHNHKGLLHSRISCDDQRRRWWGRWMWLGARWF